MRRKVAALPASSGAGGLVVGGDYQGLGIVRSLGRHGVPTCVLDDEHSIAPFSCYTTHAVRVGDLSEEGLTVDALLDVGHHLGLEGWVLFPTRDETVAAVSRHRTTLSGLYRVPTPDWDTIRWAWDKRNTHDLAAELDVPCPRTWYPKDLNELQAIEGPFPVAVKPAVKPAFMRATKSKAFLARTPAELAVLFGRAATIVEPGEVMVQELVPGDGRRQFAYCGFFRNGRALASMVVRRWRQHPPLFGRASTYVETLDLPLLEALSERVLRAIDYYGLVELEYKFDTRTDEYKLLDINARTWGYHSIGPLAGVDFPQMLFADQLGDEVEEQRARPGVSWMRLMTDVPTALPQVLRGHLSLPSYLSSLRRLGVEAVFSREDPLPGLAEIALLPYLAVRRGF